VPIRTILREKTVMEDGKVTGKPAEAVGLIGLVG
jgi:hypothetical protein